METRVWETKLGRVIRDENGRLLAQIFYSERDQEWCVVSFDEGMASLYRIPQRKEA